MGSCLRRSTHLACQKSRRFRKKKRSIVATFKAYFCSNATPHGWSRWNNNVVHQLMLNVYDPYCVNSWTPKYLKVSLCWSLLTSLNDKDVALMNTNESYTMMIYKLCKCRTRDVYESYQHNRFAKAIISVLQLMDSTMAEIYHNRLVRRYPINQAVLVLHLSKQLFYSGHIYESKHIRI